MTDVDSTLRALQPVFQSLERAHIVYFVHMSAISVFVYDHLTTFADEVEIIWPHAWNAGKIIFLIARYTTWPELLITIYIDFANVEPQFCHDVLIYGSWSTMLSFVLTSAILVLRTWALWGGSRPIFISLSSLLLAIIAADIYLIVYHINHVAYLRASDPSAVLKGCVIASTTNKLGIFWCLHTAFDLLIVVLTLIPGVQHFRFGSSNLITSLYRDSILYFVFLFALSLGNLMSIYLASKELGLLVTLLQRSFNAIIACKIIMHLQAASRVRVPTGTDTLTTFGAGLSFTKFAPQNSTTYSRC